MPASRPLDEAFAQQRGIVLAVACAKIGDAQTLWGSSPWTSSLAILVVNPPPPPPPPARQPELNNSAATKKILNHPWFLPQILVLPAVTSTYGYLASAD